MGSEMCIRDRCLATAGQPFNKALMFSSRALAFFSATTRNPNVTIPIPLASLNGNSSALRGERSIFSTNSNNPAYSNTYGEVGYDRVHTDPYTGLHVRVNFLHFPTVHSYFIRFEVYYDFHVIDPTGLVQLVYANAV